MRMDFALHVHGSAGEAVRVSRMSDLGPTWVCMHGAGDHTLQFCFHSRPAFRAFVAALSQHAVDGEDLTTSIGPRVKP